MGPVYNQCLCKRVFFIINQNKFNLFGKRVLVLKGFCLPVPTEFTDNRSESQDFSHLSLKSGDSDVSG